MNIHNNDTLKKKPFKKMPATANAFSEKRFNILIIPSIYCVYSACSLSSFLSWTSLKLFIFISAFALLAPVGAYAGPSRSETGPIKVHDVELLDQDGKKVRLGSDVISDKIVALTFTYTTCTTICPILDSIFMGLQDKLVGSLGRDIALITMSIDPVTDIPPRMKLYAGKLRAKPGWVFLTGKKENINRVLTGLDMYAPDIRKHPPAIIVGDGRRGVWRRLFGFPSSEKVLGVLKELQDARR